MDRCRSSSGAEARAVAGQDGGAAHVVSEGDYPWDGPSSWDVGAGPAVALRLDPASPWARAWDSGSAPAAPAKAAGGVADDPALAGRARAHGGGARRDDAVLRAPASLLGACRDAARGMEEQDGRHETDDDAAEGLAVATSAPSTMTSDPTGEDVWTRAVRVPCSERYMCSDVGHAA